VGFGPADSMGGTRAELIPHAVLEIQRREYARVSKAIGNVDTEREGASAG
jgi:hypothetical protein